MISDPYMMSVLAREHRHDLMRAAENHRRVAEFRSGRPGPVGRAGVAIVAGFGSARRWLRRRGARASTATAPSGGGSEVAP